MIDEDKLGKLSGGTAREIGILMVVFAPLESFFRDLGPGPSERQVIAIVGMGLLLIIGGLTIEAWE